MTDVCNHTMIYKKADASEIIQVGDILMLDPDTNYVTRAVADNKCAMTLNSRFVIGVCVKSDNASPIPIVIDGGEATEFDIERVEMDGGSSNSIETIIIESGNSEQNTRELVQIAYSGECVVNICGYVDLGDKLCISNHAGKAKAMDYLNNDYFSTRSIGKVIKFMNSMNQARVLLDIE